MGLRKFLPRLIVGIVLINLSYIICELTVDGFKYSWIFSKKHV